ncbi:MAG: N-acetylmuramoyl-L-alanine amidase [Bacteroidaceae bacterium]
MKRIPLLFLIFFLSLACTARQLRPLVWVLDAGHGGKDQGTCLKNVLEKDLTLNITNRVAALIRKNKPGIKLILTRTDDTFVSLEDRCKIANRERADLFLSIHINFAGHNLLLSGTETFHANRRGAHDIVQASHLERNAEKSELLAWLLQKNYYESGRPADRGARVSNFYVLMHTEMPAALTEVGFLSNVGDAAYMMSERGQRQIALDIYNALNEYYITTQAKTHKSTLRSLRQSLGTASGLKVDRLRDEELLSKRESSGQTDSEKTQAESFEQLTAGIPEQASAQTPDEASGSLVPSAIQCSEDTVAQPSAMQPDSIPVFSIQLFSVTKELKEGDSRLKGLAPVRILYTGSVYKVLYGGSRNYEEARATLEQIREKFPDAFIVAYIGNRAISTAEALQMKR